MSKLKLAVLICLLVCDRLNAIDSNTYFVNSATLMAPDQYLLYWNYTNTDITFKAVVKSSGWVGFGLSPNGGMAYSDLIVAYLNQDLSNNFTNRYVGSVSSLPKINPIQYWSMLYYSQMNGYTTVIFTRKLTLCNTANSINIVSGTQFLIFAWGNSFSNVNNYKDIAYHSPTNRSSSSLSLINTLNKNIQLNMSEIETFDFILNGSLSNNSDTTYFCQMFKLPDSWIQTKRHLVRYDTILAPSTSQYVHHWLVYECSASYEQVFNGTWPTPGLCFTDSTWLSVSNYCRTVSLAWAIGGYLTQYMPQNIAYPLGGPKADFKYFYIQMHYSNPAIIPNLIDNSGIRFYVTQNYRPIEFGVLTLGADTTYLAINLPPQANSMSLDFYCRQKALNNIFDPNANQSNITVFATMPHSHLAGRQMFSKVVRNATEITYLSNVQYYDFSHQYINFLNPPVTIYPNDELKLTCVYGTLDRSSFTIGGPSTHDEMCLDFLWYYPRSSSLTYCSQITEPNDWESFYNLLNQTGISIGSQKTEQIFQDFYDNSSKVQIYISNTDLYLLNYSPYKVKSGITNNTCSTPNGPNSQASNILFSTNKKNDLFICLAISLSLYFVF